MADLSFEIEPLDINIAKIQFELIKFFDSKDQKYPISKMYENKDSTLKISELNVLCYKNNEKSDKLNLDVEVWDVKKEKKYIYTLKSGTRQDIADYVKEKVFLFAIKELVLKIDEVS